MADGWEDLVRQAVTGAPMTRPTVVVLCVHGEMEPHRVVADAYPYTWRAERCPGGRVLEQAIIIERDTDGNWPKWTKKALLALDLRHNRVLDALASAQENQP